MWLMTNFHLINEEMKWCTLLCNHKSDHKSELTGLYYLHETIQSYNLRGPRPLSPKYTLNDLNYSKQFSTLDEKFGDRRKCWAMSVHGRDALHENIPNFIY